MKKVKVIKEETVLAIFQGISEKVAASTKLSAYSKGICRDVIDTLCDTVREVPSAEEEDPNCQICYWHDLRKDPDDRPDDDIMVRAHCENNGEVIDLDCFMLDGRWYLDHEIGLEVNGVIAWTDIPIFDKEASSES